MPKEQRARAAHDGAAPPGRPGDSPRHRSSRPRLAEVASAAGVSLATVSKVLNGREGVSPETRAQVERLLEEHEYVASPRRQGRTGARRTVGLIFDDVMSPYANELIRGVTEAAATLETDVVIARVADPADSRRSGSWAKRLSTAGRDGVLMVTSDLDAEQVAAFRRAQLPLVVIDPVHTPETDVTSVGVTNWAGGFAVTAHLTGLGHRRVAYLGGPAEAAVNLARRHGYRAALEKAGLPLAEDLDLDAHFGFEAGVEVGGRLIRRGERPTAVFAVNDVVALGVIQAAHTAGLRVPKDLSVVGFDDTFMAAWATPALTTVHTPLQEVGRLAVRTLARLIEGETLESHHIELATSLVVRSSTAPPSSVQTA